MTEGGGGRSLEGLSEASSFVESLLGFGMESIVEVILIIVLVADVG